LRRRRRCCYDALAADALRQRRGTLTWSIRRALSVPGVTPAVAGRRRPPGHGARRPPSPGCSSSRRIRRGAASPGRGPCLPGSFSLWVISGTRHRATRRQSVRNVLPLARARLQVERAAMRLGDPPRDDRQAKAAPVTAARRRAARSYRRCDSGRVGIPGPSSCTRMLTRFVAVEQISTRTTPPSRCADRILMHVRPCGAADPRRRRTARPESTAASIDRALSREAPPVLSHSPTSSSM